jgi:hypothetical protein
MRIDPMKCVTLLGLTIVLASITSASATTARLRSGA